MSKKILAITQCYHCGSWLCIKRILDKLSDLGNEIMVLGLDTRPNKNKNIKYISIPYFAYNRFGYVTCKNPVFGFLWYLPLFISGLILTFAYRPKVIIFNGLTSGLIMAPLMKLLGRKTIVMYHGYIGNYGAKTKRILKILGKFVDMVVVNSQGSYDDILTVVEASKIIINNHFADDLFFDKFKEKEDKGKTLNVLYVGRIDKDKWVFPLMEIAKKLREDKQFIFNFVGKGGDVNKVKKLAKLSSNAFYLGYITDRLKLKKLYQEADILWSFADTTYLALPAVEALACATPIMISKYAAITGKQEVLNKELVPSKIGWIFDPLDLDKTYKLLLKIKDNREATKKRKAALAHARKYYSGKNLMETVKIINGLIGKK